MVVGEVPTRLYVPDGADRLLLLGHGGGHGKDADRFVALCRYFAARTGLAVVCVDAVDHGERRPAGATDDLPPAWHSRAIPEMVADWMSVVDHLSSVGPPVAYVGFSMGSIFGFATVAALPTVTTAVFVVGGIPDARWSDDPDVAATLTSAASRLRGVNVLMLNKEDDELFAVADVRLLFDSVGARSKELVFSSGSHDDWDEELLARAAGFLARYASGAE